MKLPERLEFIIFRENTEDVYAGIEWSYDSTGAKEVVNFLNTKMGVKNRDDSGIGIKPISVFGSRRVGKAAIDYALKYNRKSVTVVHKGNISFKGVFK